MNQVRARRKKILLKTFPALKRNRMGQGLTSMDLLWSLSTSITNMITQMAILTAWTGNLSVKTRVSMKNHAERSGVASLIKMKGNAKAQLGGEIVPTMITQMAILTAWTGNLSVKTRVSMKNHAERSGVASLMKGNAGAQLGMEVAKAIPMTLHNLLPRKF